MSQKSKAEGIISEYNKVSGRRIKALPREKRITEAIETFDVEDFRNTFLWAKNDPWCKENNILNERVGWLCSYDIVAQHSDYSEPTLEGDSWV